MEEIADQQEKQGNTDCGDTPHAVFSLEMDSDHLIPCSVIAGIIAGEIKTDSVDNWDVLLSVILRDWLNRRGEIKEEDERPKTTQETGDLVTDIEDDPFGYVLEYKDGDDWLEVTPGFFRRWPEDTACVAEHRAKIVVARNDLERRGVGGSRKNCLLYTSDAADE